MMNNHLIDKLSVEIHLPDAGNAYELQHHISTLVHDELMTVISEHCDQLCPENTHITLENLELDLGSLPADNFVQAFSEQFIRHFPELLTQKTEQVLTADHGVSAAASPLLKTQRQTQLQGQTDNQACKNHSQTSPTPDTMKLEKHEYAWQLITYFLTHATLPWYVDAREFTGITATLEFLIDQGKLDISAFKNLLKSPPVIDRLISQLNNETLTRLYAYLTEENGGEKINWPVLLLELQRTLKQIAAKSASSVRQKQSQPDTFSPADFSQQGLWQDTQHNIRQAWKTIWGQISNNSPRRDIFAAILKPISAGLNPDMIQSFKRHLFDNQQIKAIASAGYQDLLIALENITQPVKENMATASQSSQPLVIDPQLISNKPLTPIAKRNNPPAGALNHSNKPNSLENKESTGASNRKNNSQAKTFVDKKQQIRLPAQAGSATAAAEQKRIFRPENKAVEQPTIREKTHQHLGSSSPTSTSAEIPVINSPGSTQQTGEGLPETLFTQENNQEKSKKNRGMDTSQKLNANKKSPPSQTHKPGEHQAKRLIGAGETPQTKSQQEITHQTLDKAENLPIDKTCENKTEPPVREGIGNHLSKNKLAPCFVPEVASQGLPVENAGLVIFWPYLHIYFKDLGLYEGKDFKDLQSREKAVHLLQYLATGEVNTEEHALVLNKLLCRWDFNQPLNRFVELSQREQEESEKLIQAVINHWNTLGKTSISSFRNTFLMRKGLLSHQDNGWLLRVEKGPYDILLDSIPWGLSMIKLSWADELLHVEW
ncbi:contractile injection system tape measure protein [Thalassomonas haliotis]|uniref:Uncharacterized protein n=1 Tax=Thalassomonas haliotis TaxID=485448 RepID=A0ABY7V7C0_9GAMM|nr:contractile injection system tape measure protein [Thalassomonas haliotis]WDE09536.1 hypothetical protein H3N35_14435 [Thalassomonas haliotis]